MLRHFIHLKGRSLVSVDRSCRQLEFCACFDNPAANFAHRVQLFAIARCPTNHPSKKCTYGTVHDASDVLNAKRRDCRTDTCSASPFPSSPLLLLLLLLLKPCDPWQAVLRRRRAWWRRRRRTWSLGLRTGVYDVEEVPGAASDSDVLNRDGLWYVSMRFLHSEHVVRADLKAIDDFGSDDAFSANDVGRMVRDR